MDELSSDEARRIALAAQGLRGARVKGGVAGMLRLLGAVQLDTISVLARSHELVAYARLGPVGRERVERAYWGSGSSTFEYWSHAACVIPLEEWPAFGIKRRIRLAKGKRWHVLQERDKSCGEVLARLRGDGPLTANELGGAKKGGTWFDWSETKIAAEWLLDVGTLVCRQRRGFQRVYDLAERAIPADLLAQEWSDEECAGRLVATAAAALGVATVADLAAYRGLTQRIVRAALSEAGLRSVRVAGWPSAAYVAPTALDTLGTKARGRSLLLSPFDSLIWFRDRLERLFGVRHRLEAYTPPAERQHGYFAMPVLGGNRIVGLVDPARRDGALVAKQVTVLDRGGIDHIAAALLEAASWVGATDVRVERVEPESDRSRLVSPSVANVTPLRVFSLRVLSRDSLEGFDVASVGSCLVGVVENHFVEPEVGIRCGELVELLEGREGWLGWSPEQDFRRRRLAPHPPTRLLERADLLTYGLEDARRRAGAAAGRSDGHPARSVLRRDGEAGRPARRDRQRQGMLERPRSARSIDRRIVLSDFRRARRGPTVDDGAEHIDELSESSQTLSR